MNSETEELNFQFNLFKLPQVAFSYHVGQHSLRECEVGAGLEGRIGRSLIGVLVRKLKFHAKGSAYINSWKKERFRHG